MKKVMYYRNKELITQEQKDLMLKLYGNNPYNFISEHYWNDSFNTGLIDVINILATIQNNESLNERSDKLIERIKKGLKYSTSYYFEYVEQNLLHKLISDAINEFNKIVDIDQKLDTWKFPIYEMYRIYNIPVKDNRLSEVLIKDYNKVKDIPEPTEIFEYKEYFPMSKDGDNRTVFKHYYIDNSKGEWKRVYGNDETTQKCYKLGGWVCKVYNCGDYIQIYVYDYHDRDWALHNVLKLLKKS